MKDETTLSSCCLLQRIVYSLSYIYMDAKKKEHTTIVFGRFTVSPLVHSRGRFMIICLGSTYQESLYLFSFYKKHQNLFLNSY